MLQAQQVLQGRYQLLQQLGKNAGRQTWLAKDLAQQPNCSVIIKLLAFVDEISWETLKLFEREANILRELRHPLIPRYLNSFSIDDRILWFGLIQEFIPGVSLKRLLETGKRFPEEAVCQIATEVLQILAYLHALNPPVFHRDIKPSNLIQAEDGHIYLIDFGAVQDKAAIEGATFTVVGTYGYAPMEQFGGRTVPASDLYALGATLIHLLTGVSPADLPQKNLRIQFADKTGLHPRLVGWIEKLTEPDVTHRFSTANLALEALNSIRQASENSLPLLSETAEIWGGESENPSAITYQRPPYSQIELHQSQEVLLIRLPGLWVAEWLTTVGIIILPIGLLMYWLMQLPEPLAISLFASFFLIVVGLQVGNTSVVKFTRDQVTHWKEAQLLFWRYQWIVQRVATGAIQNVFHHDTTIRRGKGTTKTRAVTLQTRSRDYSFCNSNTYFDSGLTYREGAWLVQEIKRWLGLPVSAENRKEIEQES